MTGNCKRNYRWTPADCPSISELARTYEISGEGLRRISTHLKPLLEEADNIAASSVYEVPPKNITSYSNSSQSSLRPFSFPSSCNSSVNPSRSVTERFSSPAHQIVSESIPIVRTFPDNCIEFRYDPSIDAIHSTLTVFNPSKTNPLVFKLLCNRPSLYSVDFVKGFIAPNAAKTLRIISKHQHESSHKFLIMAKSSSPEQPVINTQFDSFFSKTSNQPNNPLTNIEFRSVLRKAVTSSSSVTQDNLRLLKQKAQKNFELKTHSNLILLQYIVGAILAIYSISLLLID